MMYGNLVVVDEENDMKCVTFLRGLLKKKSLLKTSYEANSSFNKKLGEAYIEGEIYKYKKPNAEYFKKMKSLYVEKLSDLPDRDYTLGEVSGEVLYNPVIHNFTY
jgi:hypothetical protein